MVSSIEFPYKILACKYIEQRMVPYVLSFLAIVIAFVSGSASVAAFLLAWITGMSPDPVSTRSILDLQEQAIAQLNVISDHKVQVESEWRVLSCGTRIHLLHRFDERAKNGTRLLIIPGTGSYSLSYVEFLQHLTHEHVYVLDLPGWGISDCPPASMDLATAPLTQIYEFYARVIAEIVSDEPNAPHTHILSHSLGAFLTVQFLHRYPAIASRINTTLMSLPGLTPQMSEHTWFWSWLIRYSVPERLLRQWWAPHLWYCVRWWNCGMDPLTRFHTIALMNPKGCGWQILARHMRRRKAWAPICLPTLLECARDQAHIQLIFGMQDTLVSLKQHPRITELLKEAGVGVIVLSESGHNPSADEGGRRVAACLQDHRVHASRASSPL